MLFRSGGRPLIGITAQDCSAEPAGPHTGELPASHLTGIATSVLLGHSERRSGSDGAAGEGDRLIGRKLAHVAAAGLTPVLCVGDADARAETADRVARVLAQAVGALDVAAAAGWSASQLLDAGLVIAYEPIWAIGKIGRAHV